MFTQYKYNNYKHTNIYKQFMHFILISNFAIYLEPTIRYLER